MKFLFHILTIGIAVSYLILGMVAYALFWPVRTLEIVGYSDTNPIQVDTPIVHPGEPLSYKLYYCKYTDLTATVRRTLLDGQVITLVSTPGQLPTGCHTVTVKTAVVPETVNPGDYYLEVTVEYKINPLRTEYIKYHTNYFKVEAGPVRSGVDSGETILINK